MWIQDLTGLPELGHKRLLGLDVGDKTVGLALSDVTHTIATPLETIRRSKFTKDAQTLAALAAKHDIGLLVIGHPVNMDGTAGPRVQSTRAFAGNLEKILPLPMLLWDERMSTVAANRAMLEADLSRARRAELVDKLAAAYMLQGCLDAIKGRK